MKIIDAFWEERNLGVSCYELEMELSDDVGAVLANLNGLENRQYMVAKIPSLRYDLMQLFQSKGYSFIEVSIKLEYNYKKLKYQLPQLSKGVQKLCERCTYAPMDNEDLQQMKSEINKNIFHTDRIYIDPYFTFNQAAKRYNLWIDDLMSKGNIPYKYIFDGNSVGFFINQKITPRLYNSILGGVYTDYLGTGMGLPTMYASFMYFINNNIDRAITHVSSNNPEILKLHTTFGAVIKELSYVFIKHNK